MWGFAVFPFSCMMLNEEVWMLDSKNAFLLSMVVVTLKPSNFTDDLFLRSDTNETRQQVISLRCEQISHVVLSVFPLQEWPPSWPWPHSVSAPGTLSLKWPTPQLWTGSLPSATPSSSRLSLSLPPSTTSPRGATPGTEKVWFQRRYSFYSAVIHSVPHRNNEDNKEKNVLCLVTLRHRTAFITPVSTVAVSGFLNEVNPCVKGRKDPVYCTNT